MPRRAAAPRRRPTPAPPASLPTLVWVLVPVVETTDEHLACYNDFDQSLAEYTRAFAALGLEWRWQPVTLESFGPVLEAIAADRRVSPVVFNLCDGDESNGVPGLSVVRRLEELGLPYTGANTEFFDVTTSKITMKHRFAAAGVPTAPWAEVTDAASTVDIFERCGTPLIVKPAISAGSMGLTVDSVVHTEAALEAQLDVLRSGYRGWDLAGGGLLAERYVVGREFTVFLIGSADAPESRLVFPAAERVFHHSLPETECFLSFDRLWEIYERESPIGSDEYLWEYAPVPAALDARMAEVSWAAYVAVGGRGYGRVDLRLDAKTGELFVLEVNAQCGLSEDENYTSIGYILRQAQVPFHDAVLRIIAEAQAASVPAARVAAGGVARVA
jgi:D-alanine-D-alanine ligase